MERVVERPKLPLVWKLFGLTAMLILLVVGVAVALTIQRADEVARNTVNRSISGATSLFNDFEGQRLAGLTAPAVLLGNDSSFKAYVESAFANPQAIDLASLNDQLQQRRDAFRSDILILLDSEGRVVTRTDNPSVTAPSGEDLYETAPIVKAIVDNGDIPSSAGVLNLKGTLYHAAVAPIAAGAGRVIIGYLVNAKAVNEAFANQIAESTNAGVMFVPASGGSIARSTNAPSFGMAQMGGVQSILASGRPVPATTQKIDGSSYVMTGRPLSSAGQTVGAAVFLRSLDRELAPFRQIENALFIGGGVALLLALTASWVIAKRLTRPIEQLAGMAQAVTAGDYDVSPDIERSDEVGILGRAFAQMISALRDKAELEELYEQMASKSGGREPGSRVMQPAQLNEGTVLVTDLRGLPATVGEGDATNVIASLARVMKLQEKEVIRQDGEIRQILGHRLISVFPGERGTIHAIRAARAINEELADVTNPTMSVGAGIAAGDFVTGSVELAHETGLGVVGNAPLLAMLFAWHAPSGYAYVANDAAQAAGNEVMSTATKDEVRLKWLAQPLPVASLPLVTLTPTMMKTVGGTMEIPTAKLEAIPGAPPEFGQGQMFAGRYRIEQVLGRGGMGVVYRATDTQLDEVVAIKTLSVDVMNRSPEDLDRFKREIRLARKITHRNVLRTYDYGEADGVYFISMEFVRGYTLDELLDQAPSRQLAPRAAMGIARQVCRGLEAAHEQGIIHRDIKPQNVLIDAKGEVKLMDFGIARMTETKEAMTQAGLIVGTPHYMSPEQVQGKPLDPRSDVYSIGVLMYEMLLGKRPFESNSLTAVLTAHAIEPPRPLIEARPAVGVAVNEIVMRCLAKPPQQRYENAGALLADLDRVQTPAAAAA
ncbi:MAG TPA: protein kinase [Thermoanaerobaculia bacterium]|nr:protein kinase [Thermoanaerobaculia bacterium]